MADRVNDPLKELAAGAEPSLDVPKPAENKLSSEDLQAQVAAHAQILASSRSIPKKVGGAITLLAAASNVIVQIPGLERGAALIQDVIELLKTAQGGDT